MDYSYMYCMLDFDGFYAATLLPVYKFSCEHGILNLPKSTKKLVVDFGGFRICPISTHMYTGGF